ncbi:hypothetical protein V6N13_049735 [Hibiscus sabdariffa]|uniref:Uncharacterized protein n=1 Tax=Hibiscus sabdariffa TaxID=183260 RepID=A0ABR2QWZ9_9ROSI
MYNNSSSLRCFNRFRARSSVTGVHNLPTWNYIADTVYSIGCFHDDTECLGVVLNRETDEPIIVLLCSDGLARHKLQHCQVERLSFNLFRLLSSRDEVDIMSLFDPLSNSKVSHEATAVALFSKKCISRFSSLRYAFGELLSCDGRPITINGACGISRSNSSMAAGAASGLQTSALSLGEWPIF